MVKPFSSLEVFFPLVKFPFLKSSTRSDGGTVPPPSYLFTFWDNVLNLYEMQVQIHHSPLVHSSFSSCGSDTTLCYLTLLSPVTFGFCSKHADVDISYLGQSEILPLQQASCACYYVKFMTIMKKHQIFHFHWWKIFFFSLFKEEIKSPTLIFLTYGKKKKNQALNLILSLHCYA